MHRAIKIVLYSILFVYVLAGVQIGFFNRPVITSYLTAFIVWSLFLVIILEIQKRIRATASNTHLYEGQKGDDDYSRLSSDEIRRIERAKRLGELEAEQDFPDDEDDDDEQDFPDDEDGDDEPLQTGFEPGGLRGQFGKGSRGTGAARDSSYDIPNYDVVGVKNYNRDIVGLSNYKKSKRKRKR